MDQTYKIKIRLFCKDRLNLDGLIALNNQDTHYLKTVMRCKIGDIIYLFNDIFLIINSPFSFSIITL